MPVNSFIDFRSPETVFSTLENSYAYVNSLGVREIHWSTNNPIFWGPSVIHHEMHLNMAIEGVVQEALDRKNSRLIMNLEDAHLQYKLFLSSNKLKKLCIDSENLLVNSRVRKIFAAVQDIIYNIKIYFMSRFNSSPNDPREESFPLTKIFSISPRQAVLNCPNQSLSQLDQLCLQIGVNLNLEKFDLSQEEKNHISQQSRVLNEEMLKKLSEIYSKYQKERDQEKNISDTEFSREFAQIFIGKPVEEKVAEQQPNPFYPQENMTAPKGNGDSSLVKLFVAKGL